MKSATKAMVVAIKEAEQDFEWYPTTSKMLDVIKADIDGEFRESPSVLDCGAGDGRALNHLTKGDRYAIEKSKPLLQAMDKSIMIVGTDFSNQTLIDKKADVLFCNPPYSQYEAWATRIISEANAVTAYLVIPQRWEGSIKIKAAVEKREGRVSVIGEFDFLDADREARAKVHIVKVELGYAGYRGGVRKDPFTLWFESNFKVGTNTELSSPSENKDLLKEKVSNELVAGRDLVSCLESFYHRDLDSLMNLYRQLEKIDHSILSEMDINMESVMGSLRARIKGLKALYWKELFDNLSKVTDRLTSSVRSRMVDTMMRHTSVDFSAANAHAVVIWVIKNANVHFDDQLVALVEKMTEQASISLYKSNEKTYGDDDWRYGRTPMDLIRYSLELRIVLHRAGGICNSTWKHERERGNGLDERAADFIDDLRVIATNLGFDTTPHRGARDQREWSSGKSVDFWFKDMKDGDHVLMSVKAFKNGNMHIKFNQAFICRLNVEFGRLKGWLKSPKEASEELGVSAKAAMAAFGANLRLESKHLPALGFAGAA